MILGRYSKQVANEMHLWLLNSIKLATFLYDEDDHIDHLYSVYHFIRHYAPVLSIVLIIIIEIFGKCEIP